MPGIDESGNTFCSFCGATYNVFKSEDCPKCHNIIPVLNSPLEKKEPTLYVRIDNFLCSGCPNVSKKKDSNMLKFELLIDLPFLKKGTLFFFSPDAFAVYGVKEDGSRMQFPIKNSLAMYLRQLKTCGNKYLKVVD